LLQFLKSQVLVLQEVAVIMMVQKNQPKRFNKLVSL